MAYQVLYRKYRPQVFSEVIGQEHITTILKNQIATGNVSHAYMFSGTRGTGKTSTAKILARAVNCLNPQNGEPCMACEACLNDIDGSIDIIELDAASNNRVDDMRALIEKAIFAPVSLNKKVYIIDEAHMITSSAFNALLKTLEEPPSHVLFILATTEPQKIIPTIASRCQRFDFRRLRVADIVGCLQSVLEKVGAQIEPGGLLTIAAKANGGMRDALSLADQCVSFCGSKVSEADVHHILGSMDGDYMFKLSESLISSNPQNALVLLNEICAGREVPVLLSDLTNHFRALLYAKLCGDCSEVLDCTQDYMKKALEQSNKTSQERLMRALDLLTATQTQMRYSAQPRILAENALIRICCPETETTLEAALDRISHLEEQIKSGICAEPTQITHDASQTVTKVTQKRARKAIPSDANAQLIYNELCKDVKENMGTLGDFVSVSLSHKIGIEMSDGTLRVIYGDNTHYTNVNRFKTQIQSMLVGINDTLSFTPVLYAQTEEDTESALIKSFGEDALNVTDD